MTRNKGWITLILLAALACPGLRAEDTPERGRSSKTYKVDDLLEAMKRTNKGPTEPADWSEKLIEMVEANIAPGSWSDKGGPGSITYDRKSGSLVVSHQQDVQGMVGFYLALLGADCGPKSYAVEMKLGYGAEGPTYCRMLPKVTVLDGQRARVAMKDKAPSLDPTAKPTATDFLLELQVMPLDEEQVGVNLDLQTGKEGTHTRLSQSAKPGEPFKMKVGTPAKGQPQEWLEVVVSEAGPDAAEVVAAPPMVLAKPMPSMPELAMPEAQISTPSPWYLKHPPQYIPQALTSLPAELPTRLVPVPREIQQVDFLAQDECQEVVPAGLMLPTAAATKTLKKEDPKPKATVTFCRPGGQEITVRTVGSRVHITSGNSEAWADHVTFDSSNDSILLEGNVHVTCPTDSTGVSVHAPKLRILKDFKVDFNP